MTQSGDHTSTDDRASGLILRALDSRRRGDYVLAFAIAALPIGVAYLIGAHRSIEEHVGYWESPNWWSLAIILPGLLYLFRLIMAKVIPVGSPWPSSACPPIVNLVRDESARQAVYEGLRGCVLSRWNTIVPFVITVIVHVLDAPAVFGPYFGEAPADPTWANVFLASEDISKTLNLVLLVCAGLAQFCVAFLGLLSIVLIFRHNLFFLGNVYQRRWVLAGEESHFFQINPRDVNRCFGFRVANEAFNAQVLALMIAGVAMFLSRSASSLSEAGLVTDLLQFSPSIPDLSFPLPSQWIMSLSWLAALGVVAMPALVKLLPRLPGRGAERVELSVGNYLREFFPDRAWPRDRSGRDESVQQVAGRFAQNHFWPTGDNRAGMLFFFAYWIFFVTLLPPPTERLADIVVNLVFFAILAYLVRRITFWALEQSLRYVDDLLVGKGAPVVRWDSVEPDSDPSRDIGVFISYRRRDSAPYARSLHERLLDEFPAERVFMDIADIEAGENFIEKIDRSLEAVAAVVVVIGREWLTIADGDSRPRIEDPDDMVRVELATALRHDKRIFPVTVGGASMPAASQLPDELRGLTELNALDISDTRWSYDVDRLIEALKRL